MSETKLKPCPFCGGEAKIVKYCSKKTIVYVECTKCLSYMGNQRIITSFSREKEYFESEEKLINAWNTRTPMANIVEKLEEIQERYDDIAFMEMNTNGHTLDFEYAHGKKDGVQEAINIVKQEINNGLE